MILSAERRPFKTTEYAGIILNDKPVAYYRLDETSGTIAHDISGNGNNGTITGGVTLGQPGAIADGDTAMKFNGSSGYIGTSYVQTSVTSYSIEAWVSTTDAPTGSVPIVSDRGSGSGLSLTLAMPFGSGGNVAFGCDSNGIFIGLQSSGEYNDGKWHHVVGTWDGQSDVAVSSSQFSLYVDGVEASAIDDNIGSATAPLSGLGGTQIAYSVWGYFNGLIDEVAIYNYALTAEQVQEHYNAGKTGVLKM